MRRLKFLLVLLLFSIVASSQDANNLALDATVKDQDGGKLTGASISLIQDGALVNKINTGKNGRFDLLLDFDHEYSIEVTKTGYVTKRMYVNTRNVPEDEQLWGYEFGGFIVDLFKDIEGVDFSMLEQPIAKVYYDPNLQNFDYDKIYTKQIKAQLDELLDDYEAQLEREEQMAKQRELDFQLAMTDAENAFLDGDLLLAKENYLAAATLQPENEAPQKKINEIEKQLEANASSEEKYMSLLASADQLFGSQKFNEAITKYEEALKLKPNEEYPQKRIDESQKAYVKLLADQKAKAELAEKDKKYNDALSKADEAYTSESYENAKVGYQNALSLKPKEEYPQSQLKMIEVRIKQAAEAKEKSATLAAENEKYNALIAKADVAFNSGNWENARKNYAEAINVKPNEVYPSERLTEIDLKIAELAESEKAEAERLKLESDYRLLISTADKDFEKKNYAAAKSAYSQALALKQEEYPLSRIAEIDKLLAEAKASSLAAAEKAAMNAQYAELIKSADEALKKESFEEALSSYSQATEIKPDENYPKAQIEKIKSLQAQNETERAYANHISQGDDAFNRADYETAKSSYNLALEIKPADKYATNRIAEADQKLLLLANKKQTQEEQQKNEADYANALSLADASFAEENFEDAILKYQAARAIKPKEKYPQEQIDKSNSLLKEREQNAALAAEQEALVQRYDAKIKEADNLLSLHELEKAKETYNLAAGIKPDETYPADQIVVIDKLIAERKAREEELAEQKEKDRKNEEEFAKYTALVKAADALMDKEDYLNAKPKYEESKTLRPAETYPDEQLKKIEQKLKEKQFNEELAEKQRGNYNNAMSEGNTAVLNKDWDKARTSFQAALEIYPDEPAPANRLKEVDDLEERHKKELLEAEFKQVVNDADAAFLKKEYQTALDFYNKAMALKQEDGHSKARIAKINEILNQSKDGKDKGQASDRMVKEENYNEGNAKVTVRTVTYGDKVDVYKRVVHSWGGKYYFLNDQPITELVWNRDSQ